MRERPTLCLVMAEFLTWDLLSSEHHERLSRAYEVLDPAPLARFGEPCAEVLDLLPAAAAALQPDAARRLAGHAR
jgi:hypothetical protein